MRDKYERTTLLSLASFLLARGQSIVGINSTGKGAEKEFAFVITPLLEELIHAYRFAPIGDIRLTIDVKLYEQARNELLSALKDYK